MFIYCREKLIVVKLVSNMSALKKALYLLACRYVGITSRNVSNPVAITWRDRNFCYVIIFFQKETYLRKRILNFELHVRFEVYVTKIKRRELLNPCSILEVQTYREKLTLKNSWLHSLLSNKSQTNKCYKINPSHYKSFVVTFKYLHRSWVTDVSNKALL
jgi:hypothetical protein